MASTYTTNKNIEKPSNGSYNDDWDVPVNADWDDIDRCFGGNTQIIITGVAGGAYALSPTQYQPPNITFRGNMSGTLVYLLPTDVGGLWSVFNDTDGAFSLSFGSSGGSSLAIPAGQRSYILCDGVNTGYADTGQSASTLAAAESFATTAANNAQATAISTSEAFATAADVTVFGNAQTYAVGVANTAQSNAETYALAQAMAAQTTAISTSEAFTTTSIKANYRAGTFNCINGTVTVTFSTPFPAGTTPIVVTSFNYVSYNAGSIPTGTITNAGFQFANSNAGPVAYYATVAN